MSYAQDHTNNRYSCLPSFMSKFFMCRRSSKSNETARIARIGDKILLPPPYALKRVSGHIFQRCDAESDMHKTVSTQDEPKASQIVVGVPAQRITSTMDDVTCLDHDLCYLCSDRPADAVLIECGHGGLCAECADSLWRRGAHQPAGRSCPLCRQTFIGIMRIVSETDGVAQVEPQHYPGVTDPLIEAPLPSPAPAPAMMRNAWGDTVPAPSAPRAAGRSRPQPMW